MCRARRKTNKNFQFELRALGECILNVCAECRNAAARELCAQRMRAGARHISIARVGIFQLFHLCTVMNS